MTEYLVKCVWHSTSFTLKVWAVSETDALARAKRNKNARTALSFKIVGTR